MSQTPVALEPALITTITAPSVPDVCKETCDVLMQFRGWKCFYHYNLDPIIQYKCTILHTKCYANLCNLCCN